MEEWADVFMDQPEPDSHMSILSVRQAVRIVFVSHYADLYGANRSLLALIGGLSARGIESGVLLSSTGPLVERLKEREVEYRVFGFRQWMGSRRIGAPVRAARTLGVLPSMSRWVRSFQPDVIYTNSSVVPVGAYLAAFLGLPHVWHLREFGEADYGLKRDCGNLWFRYWLGKADALISVSTALQEALTKGIDTAKYVVYNGVATTEQADQLLALSQNSSSVRSGFTFAIVGLLSPQKGQEDAIRALGRLSSRGIAARLLVAGSGNENYEGRLGQLCRELGVARETSFLGYVEDPFQVYRQADGVLMCSEQEAMGRVTAEAMIAARPVIGRATGGTPELVTHGFNGLLYNGTVSELASCMEKLVNDPVRAQRMGRRGWRRARQEFVVEVYTDRVASILHGVVND